jgi:pimeloyl-ACP methyl ester carboxylesterase
MAAEVATLATVATFTLIHGGGGSGWDWHLVVPELQRLGHEAVAVDLPSEDETAGWQEYADTVVAALGHGRNIVVGHSLGGFTAPLACERATVEKLVLVAAMIPAPGELFSDWWTNVGYPGTGGQDDDVVFYHDVSKALTEESKRRARSESSRALREPWPLASWPDTATTYLLCRDDRMFPPMWARAHARERLGVEADEIEGGHYVTLIRPHELAARLDAYARPGL